MIHVFDPCEIIGQRHEFHEPVFNSVLNQIDTKFPDSNNLVISTFWIDQVPDSHGIHSRKYLKYYDNVFCVSTNDWYPAHRYVEFRTKGKNFYNIGGDKSKYYYSFWAHTCYEHFIQEYFDESKPVRLTELKYKFLCYNRKFRPWRAQLVEELYERDLVKHGVVTLGDRQTHRITQDKYPLCYKHTPIRIPKQYSEVDFVNLSRGSNPCDIPNDILSLGNDDIWQQSFLNVVSETTLNCDIFLSEKIFKPIIGLRPFVVLGDTGITDFLKANGFKTFDKWLNLSYTNSKSHNDKIQGIVGNIETICKMTNSELVSMYNDMLPDLEHNRQRFTEYSLANAQIIKKGIFR